MRRFRRVFWFWFLALACVFALANVWGLLFHASYKDYTGFPVGFYCWGFGLASPWDFTALAIDVVVALACASGMAVACAFARTRRRQSLDERE